MTPERRKTRIPDVMEPTGRTDQHKGAQYRCRECGALRWTAWGNARRHKDHCQELEERGSE